MAIIGNSGSGKSTFLNMIGGLDKPSAGKLFVDGKNLFTMTEKQLVDYKRKTVGFVWQNNGRNLFPYLTAVENVMVPMQIGSEKKCKERALELLDMVGLAHKKSNKLSQLSGGEQQRVAIAIAVANSPKLLLADEPTGSVDSKTSEYILDVFRHMNREWGQTIILVTHDVLLSKKVQRVAAIRDGKISSERILKETYVDVLDGAAASWDEDTQDEFAVIDRAGRVQIPREFLDTMNLDGNKVRMSIRDGRITLEK